MRWIASVALALMMFLCACAQQPYERLHTALEIMADAYAATDKVLEVSQAPTLTKAREAIPAEYEGLMKAYVACLRDGGDSSNCSDPGDPTAFVEGRLTAHLGRWADVRKGLDVTREAILAGEVAAKAWRDNKEPPADFHSICVSIGEGTGLVMSALNDLKVDVPPAWDEASRYVGPLCLLVGARVERALREKTEKGVVL